MSVHVLVQHGVEDFGTWKTVFDEHDETRQEYGQLGYDLYCDSADDTYVCILMEFEEEARAKEFTESDELKEAMKRAGVTGEPEVTFLTLEDEKHIPRPTA